MLTALLFYFGRLHVTGYFRYFGVNYTILGLTVQDHLIRSADGLFVPIAGCAAGALIAFWIRRLLLERLGKPTRRTIPIALTLASGAIGAALLALATIALLDAESFRSRPELGGLSLAAGVLLLTYTVHMTAGLVLPGPVRAPSVTSPALALAEWGAVFLMVSVGLFWAVGAYAIGVGTGRAEQTAAQLGSAPNAVLYSEKSLSLRAPGVREAACKNSDSSYRFRYDGLKLVLQAGDQYLFLPAEWTQTDGAALVIPRTDSLRLEFSRGPQRGIETC